MPLSACFAHDFLSTSRLTFDNSCFSGMSNVFSMHTIYTFPVIGVYDKCTVTLKQCYLVLQRTVKSARPWT